MNDCTVSGTMKFTGGCDVIYKCETAFVMSVLDTDCCSGCEPAVCECSPTTVNGLSGAVTLTSPDDSVTIETNGQDVELVVSGFEPLVPDYSMTSRLTGRKWIDGQEVFEVVISGLAPSPGQSTTLHFLPPLGGGGLVNIIKSHLMIFSPNHFDISLPIPCHGGSGVPHAAGRGTWTVVAYDVCCGTAVEITASADAFDFNGPGITEYGVHGIIEFVRCCS